MASGDPKCPGFLYALGCVVGVFLFGVGSCLVLFKIIDSLLARTMSWRTFSYMAIFLGSLIYMVLFNIFADNLYQFNQGNYSYSLMGVRIFLKIAKNLGYQKGIVEKVADMTMTFCLTKTI